MVRRAEAQSRDANTEGVAALVPRQEPASQVLVLAPQTWGPGGIERATRSLLRALADLYGSERVALLSVWGGVGSLPCRIVWHGPKERGARPVPIWTKMRFAAAAVAAARWWRRNLVIIACHPHLAPLAWVAARASGAPYAVWCHGCEVWGPLRPLVRRALRAANAVVAPSKFTASMAGQTSGMDKERVTVIPHTLASDVPIAVTTRSRPRSHPRVLSVTRLAPEHAYKGLDTLIASWPLVLKAVPHAELQIVGDGPDRSRLHAESARLELDGRVRFVGALDDAGLARAYAEAAVFALPVRTTLGRQAGGEGFGLVFLEAAAAGLPVVAGNGGAIPEVVLDGETGLLVDPGAPDEVAGAIIRLLRAPELAQRMGGAAKQRAQQEFSYERFRKRISELVERIKLDG